MPVVALEENRQYATKTKGEVCRCKSSRGKLMKRQCGCGQGVRETQHGHGLSKLLLLLAVDELEI